ncbi:MAG TPA: protein-L-isoaspartate O-methyltransferase [Sphingobium sp.]|nr:protein-L-isoaspartate O-methyltransferase [Sphingobium sp.]
MSEEDFAAMRAAMVASQLRPSDVNDPAVLAAMAEVPREDYVPAARRETAYVDRPIPLGNGRAMNAPLATGRLLDVAQIRPGDKVLLIGDSTGYTATLLTHMGAVVTAVGEGEKPAQLPESVKWIGMFPAKGGKEGGSYDVLLIDGAVPELPAALTAQVAEDGRLAFGLVQNGVTRLCSGRKAGGSIGFSRLHDIEMVLVPGLMPEDVGFVF